MLLKAGSIEFPEYTVNLKKYIDIMRTTLPDLAIGMNIIAKPAIEYYNDPKIDCKYHSIVFHVFSCHATRVT